MGIPTGITRAQIEAAARWIDANGLGGFRDGSKFEVQVGGKWYPPKALIGRAAGLKPGDFSSGEQPGQAVGFLRALEFPCRTKPGRR